MIKDAYEDLRKRFKSLPAFEEIDTELELSALENEHFLLRNVKKRLEERLEDLSSMLGDIVHPSSESPALVYEWRCFDQKEKKAILALYKRVQFLMRAFCEADLISTDQTDAQLIIEAFKAWKDIRKECIPLAKRLKECWTKEIDYKEDLGYLG